MDDIINRIIEVEKKAQSMTEQSRQGLETAKKDIKNKIAKSANIYFGAALVFQFKCSSEYRGAHILFGLNPFCVINNLFMRHR